MRTFRLFGPRVAVAATVVIGALLVAGEPAGATAPPTAGRATFPPGMPLTEALLELQAEGIHLVFSSLVVRPEMRVGSTPLSSAPRAILDELLAAHGLAVEEGEAGSLVVVPASGPPPPGTLRGAIRSRRALTPVPGVSVTVAGAGLEAVTDGDGRFEIGGLEPGSYTVEARRPGFVIERLREVEVRRGAVLELSLTLQPAPLSGEEIAVQASRISLLHEVPAAPFALSRDEILGLPHLAGDVFRALSLLPGTASNDVTAQFHVRGGRREEVLVLLDGQELYDAYHLKDFDNAASIVPASVLGDLDLTTGTFPASYGDRLGGILDMSSLTPGRERRLRLSVGLLSAELEGSGSLGDRTGWLASLRRGATDLAGRVLGREDPSFWDVFAKVEHRWGDGQSLRVNLLRSADRLDFVGERDGERTGLNTDYDSAYLWLTHQGVLSDRLFVDTALSESRIDRDRRGLEDEEEKRFDVEDRRELGVAGLVQSWNLQASSRHFLQAGVELRRFDVDYDYRSFRAFDSPFVALRAPPRQGVFDFRGRFTDRYLAAYLSDRLRLGDDLTVEVGVRHDRHSLTGDREWSPRVDLAWGVGAGNVLRLGWGTYLESQRAYELAVEDGDTRFYPAERSEQWVAGFEHHFRGGGGGPVAAWRIELYHRRLGDPRPRYESLFEPFAPFPEGELDRFRLAPQESVAQGAELFLQGRSGRRLSWWLSFSRASTDDLLDGRRVPRQIDQRYAANVDLDYRLGRHWNLNLAWRFHTGWPTTPVSLVVGRGEDGEVDLTPVLGALNSERLPAYHRLDLRLSRGWQLALGRLSLFFDVQNLYNRANVAGFDLEVDEAAAAIRSEEERWPGFFASAGVTWEL